MHALHIRIRRVHQLNDIIRDFDSSRVDRKASIRPWALVKTDCIRQQHGLRAPDPRSASSCPEWRRGYPGPELPPCQRLTGVDLPHCIAHYRLRRGICWRLRCPLVSCRRAAASCDMAFSLPMRDHPSVIYLSSPARSFLVLIPPPSRDIESPMPVKCVAWQRSCANLHLDLPRARGMRREDVAIGRSGSMTLQSRAIARLRICAGVTHRHRWMIPSAPVISR